MLEYQHATDDLRMKLGKLPDLEKMLAKFSLTQSNKK